MATIWEMSASVGEMANYIVFAAVVIWLIAIWLSSYLGRK